MPVPDQRDPEVTRVKLEAWLRERLTDATQVRVPHVQTPSTTGNDFPYNNTASQLLAKTHGPAPHPAVT